MYLRRLQIEQLRIIVRAAVELAPGMNVFSGANGSGKTSLLEAVHVLAYGRSFRTAGRGALIRRGSDSLVSFAEVQSALGQHRIGLRRSANGFEGQVDGQAVAGLSELFRHCPFICFEPDSGSLIVGPAELRRRYLDWGLFHVEPDFLPAWRRYQRALRQRNAWLRTPLDSEQASIWEQELAIAAPPLNAMREHYIAALSLDVEVLAQELVPELGRVALRYRRGWPAESELTEVLAASRERDTRLGYTGLGPHRAAWDLQFERIPVREEYSRGQAKLAALLMVLAQVRHFTRARGEPPIVGLDDMAAELDATHYDRALGLLRGLSTQILLTRVGGSAFTPTSQDALFHVEQGAVTRLL